MLPLIKRVYPKLLASQIVGVQPLSQPASLAHYLRYRYANRGKFVFEMFDNGYARILELTDEFIIIDADLQKPNCECVRIRINKIPSDKIEVENLGSYHGTSMVYKTTVKFEDGTEKEGYHDATYFNIKHQAFKVIWI